MISSAVIPPDHVYRYELRRSWGTVGPTATFVMLNPSTADAHVDDPTIRRCIRFAQREGCDSLTVINLFAWRATDPRDLPAANWAKVIGPDNDQTWTQTIGDTGPLIAAWGSASALRYRSSFNHQTARFLALCHARDVDVYCLGTTFAGHPRHPLYVRGDQTLERFRP